MQRTPSKREHARRIAHRQEVAASVLRIREAFRDLVTPPKAHRVGESGPEHVIPREPSR